MRRALARERPAVRKRPAQSEWRKRDCQAHALCRNDDTVGVGGLPELAFRPGALVETVAAFPRRVRRAVGGDHPGSRRDRAVAAQVEHARQIGRQERYAADNAVAAFQPHAAFALLNQTCATQRFHDRFPSIDSRRSGRAAPKPRWRRFGCPPAIRAASRRRREGGAVAHAGSSFEALCLRQRAPQDEVRGVPAASQRAPQDEVRGVPRIELAARIA